MSTQGKYVRAAVNGNHMEEGHDDSFYSDELLSTELGAVEVIETDEMESYDESNGTTPGYVMIDEGSQSTIQEEIAASTPPSDASLHERIAQLEKVIEQLTKSSQPTKNNNPISEHSVPPARSTADEPQGWSSAGENNITNHVNANIRWEHIPPFPKDIPANKLWETWKRFLENFEIAVSLSSVSDPAYRAKALFLSMGPELQGIVRAAKLRPNLEGPSCYSTFVANIDVYLKSMTDTL